MENPIEISNMITDKYVSRILMATSKKPKSAAEISKICDIPIAVCYRKILSLENLGFVRCSERRLNQRGKRVGFYLSQIKHMHLFLEDGKFRMKIKMADGGWDYYSDDDGAHVNGKATRD